MNVEKDIEIEGKSMESYKAEAIKAKIGTIARNLWKTNVKSKPEGEW
jgi:hypothetical protein